MKTVIVYAHPQTPGHCPEILKEVEAYHKEHGIEYELLDLYKMKYDPVLHENEHYTAGEGHWDVSKENKRIRQLILDNNKLIFIYPVWWNSM
ncbi:MAG: NAD(P)H-dependent oxidoreductase, partial [Candidatus Woesearchaeota archaeon]|nr:NAD(P)H-dependent oxidoreductase [Candidatus Woesearchaeota archaeon]